MLSPFLAHVMSFMDCNPAGGIMPDYAQVHSGSNVGNNHNLTELIPSMCVGGTHWFCLISIPFEDVTDSKTTVPELEKNHPKQVQKWPKVQEKPEYSGTGTPEKKDTNTYCFHRTSANNYLHRSPYLPGGGCLGIRVILFKEGGGV